MPNIFTDNRDAWLRMSEIDYLGQFVKTWLAFNAWYRSATTEKTDRNIIDWMKWKPNQVLSKLRPMLEAAEDEAVQFRSEIAQLHQRLDNYEIHAFKGEESQRITLRNVYLGIRAANTWGYEKRGYRYRVELQTDRKIAVEVVNIKTSARILTCLHDQHNIVQMESLPSYRGLTEDQRSRIRQLYLGAAPNWYCDLTTYTSSDVTNRPIECGAFTFNCGKEALFAGTVETIYQMRCTLFHGELAPTKEAIACYEPAYRLVRRFLDCITT